MNPLLVKNSNLVLAIVGCAFLAGCKDSENSTAKSATKTRPTATSSPAASASKTKPISATVNPKASIELPATKIPETKMKTIQARSASVQVEGIASLENYKRAVAFATIPKVNESSDADSTAKISFQNDSYLVNGYTQYRNVYFVNDARRGFAVKRFPLNTNQVKVDLTDKEAQQKDMGWIVDVSSTHGLGYNLKSDISEIDNFAAETSKLSDRQFNAMKQTYAFAIVPVEMGGLGFDSQEASALSVKLAKDANFNVAEFRRAWFFLTSDLPTGTHFQASDRQDFDRALALATRFSGYDGNKVTYNRFWSELQYVQEKDGMNYATDLAIRKALQLSSLSESASADYKDAIRFAKATVLQARDIYTSKEHEGEGFWGTIGAYFQNVGNNFGALYTSESAFYRSNPANYTRIFGLGLRNQADAQSFADSIFFGQINYSVESVNGNRIYVPQGVTKESTSASYKPDYSTIKDLTIRAMLPMIEGGFSMNGQQASKFAFDLAWIRWAYDYFNGLATDTKGLVTDNVIDQMQQHYVYALYLADEDGNRVYTQAQALEYAREKAGLPPGGVVVSPRK
jgi:hypothetical protein